MATNIPTVASGGGEYTYDEARIEAARLNTLSLARFNAEADRALGTSNRNTGGPASVSRPDGSAVGNLIGSLSTRVGSVTNITNSILPGASLLTSKLGSLIQDPTKTTSGLSNLLGLFGGSSSGYTALGGGPPFPNRLEQFASYSALWTLACITPTQFNNPSSYRGNPGALENVVFSSAGRYDGQRTATAQGIPEFFVDNVNIDARVSPMPGAGNSFSTKLNFDIIEPYSMGLFLQSLQVAAVKSGFPNYLSDCPFLFKLEIVGNTDDGGLLPATETLTRYFTVKITDVKMSVTEGGSKYAVNAVPLHQLGMADTVNTVYTDAVLAGKNVAEVLSSGERSLVNVLNTSQKLLVTKGTQAVPDVYEIVFPSDASDPIGTQSSANSSLATSLLTAIKDPNMSAFKRTIAGNNKSESPAIGNSPIASASMNFTAESGGNPEFKKENDLVSTDGRTIQRGKMSIDTESRTFTFPAGERINEIVQRVVLSSDYTTKALEKVDAAGMHDWFRLDVQIQLLEYDALRNLRAKKYVIRVLPYKVGSELYKSPSAPAQGQKARQGIIAKRYDYIYTGQNNDILKFDLTFDGMFFTGAQPRPTGDNKQINNPNINSPVDSPRGTNPVQQGSAGPTVNLPTSAQVKPDPKINSQTPTGNKTPEKMVEDAFQNAYMKSSADMINLEIDIIGDTYYLSDSGLNSNYFAKKGPNDQTTADESMNYEGSEIFVYLSFRTPVEPNLSVVQQGGLYDFPQAGESPYSGVFKVVALVHKFSNGTFTQTLNLIRIPGQGGDYIGIQNIIGQNNRFYKTTVPVPPKSTPASDAVAPADQDAQGQFDGEYVDPALAESRNTAEGTSDLSSARSSGTESPPTLNQSRAAPDAPNDGSFRGNTAAEDSAMMDQIRREQAATDPEWARRFGGTSR
jgi:hypothetical protein